MRRRRARSCNFPVLADADRRVSDLYGMIHPESDPLLTVRSVFVIDPAKKIRAMIVTIRRAPGATTTRSCG